MSKPKLTAIHGVIVLVIITIIIGAIIYLYVARSDIGIPVEYSGEFRGMSASGHPLFSSVKHELIIGDETIKNITGINERGETYLLSLLDKDITLLLWEYEDEYKYVGAYINE